MALRQTLLSFAAALTSPKKKEMRTRSRPSSIRSDSPHSSDTSDTIEVEIKQDPVQLPTPEETATESSSVTSTRDVSSTRPRRVSKRLSNGKSAATPRASPKKDTAKNRNVSGETLVNGASESQDSLVRTGIDSLNLPWNMSNMSNIFNPGSKADLGKSNDNEAVASTDTVNTVVPEDEEDSEDEKERAAKAAAKKKKMQQNSRLWEKRKKLADKNATRRSSRASMLTKASDFASVVAESVLGKRKDRGSEVRSSPRIKRTMDAAFGAAEEPDSKKRRVSDNNVPAATQSAATPVTTSNKKAPRPPRDKKWLASGLYAGQQRAIDARHHSGAKDKRKSTSEVSEKENPILPLPMFFGERLLKEGRDFKLPFDVFSPLPPGQPKPDEWRKSNKNVFVGDAAQEWRVAKQTEYSACICMPETGCDQDCMNKYMYYECDSKNCNLSAEECGNRAFDDLRKRVKKGGKYNIGVEVIKTATRGHGVRSNRTFDPNQIIVEYSGEVINQDECDRRMRKEYKSNECYYLMLFDQNMIIDATTKGSIARFVNHSCNPNCRMEKWTVNGQPRMALFAGEKGIMTGEELTYDYNFDPFSQKNVQECRCGEPCCRGILGPRPKKDDRKSEEMEDEPKKEKSLKRKMAEALEDAIVKVTKKRKTETRVQVKTKSRARVYSNVSPKKTPAIATKAKAVVKAVRGSTASPIKASSGLARNPSKLRKMMKGAKEKAAGAKASAAAGIKKSRSGRRLVSSTSATEALIEKEIMEKKTTQRAQLKSKVGSVKSSLVKTVRGRQSGHSRSMRVVSGEE